MTMGHRKCVGCTAHHQLLSCLLLSFMAGSLDSVYGGQGNVWSSMRFPDETVGPDNWRYYRGWDTPRSSGFIAYGAGKLIIRTVELPPAFSLLTISLNRHWPNDDDGNTAVATVPLVCFGFHGPPLIVPPRESLLDAAITAGANQNASATGECGWFNETVVLNVTNLEVRSGILHLGVFSDAKPTRTQSKMIPRGKIYAFGLSVQVFRCKSEGLGGPKCDLEIGFLPLSVSLGTLHTMNTIFGEEQAVSSSNSSRNKSEKDLQVQSDNYQSSEHTVHRTCTPSFDLSELGGQTEAISDEVQIIRPSGEQDDEEINSGEPNWIQLSQQCVGRNDKRYFNIHIVDFIPELEIKYDCISNVSLGISKCEEFESMVKESRIPLLHLRRGALPSNDTSDYVGEPSTGSIIVTDPKRGWWYLAIFIPVFASYQEAERQGIEGVDDEICLTLGWKARTCRPGLLGDNCQWPVALLERILKREYESPFDSYYLPASRPDLIDQPTEWISQESLFNASILNSTLEQWRFVILKVADGAAGGVLSIDMKTPQSVHAELYVHHEGCPVSGNWDYRVMESGTQPVSKSGGEILGLGKDADGSKVLMEPKYRSLSLPVVYPMQGYWCLGVRYVPYQTNEHETLSNGSHDVRKQLTQRPREDWLRRWKRCLATYKRKLSVLLKGFWGERVGAKHAGRSTESFDLGNADLLSGNDMKLRVTLHGCANACSGHGNCQTEYEASRLYYVSYCHCDRTHGDIDCSVVLLKPWNDMSHRLLLIFSNAAAILPSTWALRHKAFSEWITFALSGFASAIYHSCDAGGWCALSYSTLQFLDFWLSFVAIIMTCLYMAGFTGPSKAMLHIGCAILTAAVAKENATSQWSVLVVVLMSSTGLLLGWGLETRKISSLLLEWRNSPTRSNVPGLQLCKRWARSFYMQLRERFHWPYLWLGLAFLLGGLLSNRMELPETYWIWHSCWHIGIYTSAFFLLHSTKAVELASSRNGYHVVARRQDDDSITDSQEADLELLGSTPEGH